MGREESQQIDVDTESLLGGTDEKVDCWVSSNYSTVACQK